MYSPDAIRTETGLPKRAKAILRALSTAQRTVIAGVLSVCLVVVSGAAVAPARNAMNFGAGGSQVSQAMASTGVPATTQADGAALLESVSVPLRMTGQNRLLPTQMAYLGEIGSEFNFRNDGLLPTPNAEAGSEDGDDAPSASPAVSGHYGAFGAPGNQHGAAGTMGGAWIGAASGVAGLGTTGPSRRTPAVSDSASANSEICAAGAACAGSALIAANEAVTMVERGNDPRQLVATPPPATTTATTPASAPKTAAAPTTAPAPAPAPAPARATVTAPATSPVLAAPIVPAASILPPVASLTIDDLALTNKPPAVIRVATADLPPASIPEPASLALLSAGVALLVFFLRRRSKHPS
ncbi:MAG: PEP-CTERM sorting domain-containing protein [Herminiimonas sp.]|nr:PEP-CTERM sorting domain-containing protein [Herminiimonas sp.]